MDATGGDNLEAKEPPKRSTNSARISRQFWQAGEFLPELDQTPTLRSDKTGLDHARLHPRFLHSNATSHKWALGALVELLDNSMDEVSAGCNYVNVDKMDHPVDGDKNPVLLVEDNGGGMDESTIRNCMSFGFSLKHGKKMIGQYGNGFKTSTMRLGADALVLTKSMTSQTCSIGLLSYTFLTETNSQDVVVPIIDYNLQDRTKITRGDERDWKSKLDIICEWGPFGSEAEVWSQLDSMPTQGTRVYIWNLWQTSDDLLELDFGTDEHDIRLGGSEEEAQEASNRKKRADEGIRRCHAYKHSLRSYVSLLYLEWPEGFQVTLRGKEILPVPVTEGMKHVVMYDYRPRSLPKEDINSADTKVGPVSVPVYIGFATEAPETSVSGFCVYHRNRLIKPFWKVYASASSVGRGVIGFLQVDFVEPAHDKQDFENTPPLQKLEKYLKRQVPQYWRSKAHLVGYQDHLPSRNEASGGQDLSPNPKSAKKPTNNTQNNTGAASKTEDPPDSPPSDKTPPAGVKEFSEGHKSRPGKTPVPQAKQNTDPVSGKADGVQKTAAKCFQEMQHQVSQLQQTVQDFCNKYDIKEDAQMVLGRIFGTTMSKVLDPAREMKRLHSSHLKTFKNTLQYIAEMKANSKLTGPIPEFILTEMETLGIQVKEPSKDLSNGDPMEIDSTETKPMVSKSETKEVLTRTPKRKAAPEQEAEIEKDDQNPAMEVDIPAPQVITPEEVIPLQRSQDPHSLRKESEAPPTRKQKTEQSNQQLARLGLSVMEKFLKTKPNKVEIVQIQPGGGTDLQSMEVMRIEDVEKTTIEETIDCCTPDKQPSIDEQEAPVVVEQSKPQDESAIPPTT